MGLGDAVMATGRAKDLNIATGKRIRIVGRSGAYWSEVFDNNPRLAKPDEHGDFFTLVDGSGIRPYIAGKTNKQWEWRPFKPTPGELYLTDAEEQQADRLLCGVSKFIVLDPNIKRGASPNKQWPWNRWNEVATLLRGKQVVQLTPPRTRTLAGVKVIQPSTFRIACAVLKRARAAVLHEGALAHAAASFGVRSVVIMGGYISPAILGYDCHINLFTGGTPCGMRVKCPHCETAMNKIMPRDVVKHLEGLL